jgi:hypothetical protein
MFPCKTFLLIGRMQYADITGDDEEPLPIELQGLLDKIEEELRLPPPGDIEPKEGYNFDKFKEDYVVASTKLLAAHGKYLNKSLKFREIEEAIISIRSEKYLERFLEILDDFRKTEMIVEAKEELNQATKEFQCMKKTASILGDCDMGNKYTCFLCLKNGIDVAFSPCGHVVCSDCNRHPLRECPFCRTLISSAMKLYISN